MFMIYSDRVFTLLLEVFLLFFHLITINVLFILSVNLKHENDNKGASHRILVSPIK